MRTSVQPRQVMIRGLRRYVLIARTTYPGMNNGQPRVLVVVVGNWREGYDTKAEALRAARPLRATVRRGAGAFELSTFHESEESPKD